MTPLAIGTLGYVAAAALAGLLLGYLVWGWRRPARIAAARAEGALSARTSLDGDTGLRAQLQASSAEQARLEAEIDRLTERLARLEGEAAPASAQGGRQAPPGRGTAADDSVQARRDSVEGLAGAGTAGSHRAESPEGVDAPGGRMTPTGTGGHGTSRAPDAALRQQIMAEQPPGEETGGETTAGAAGDDGSERPRPPAFTRASQHPPEPGEPPVIDEQVPPGAVDSTVRDGVAGGAMPVPAGFTRRSQAEAGPDEPPVADEQVPPGTEGAGDGRPDMPRPPESTARAQAISGDEPPVADEQVPPGEDDVRRARDVFEPPQPDEQVRPGAGGRAGAPEGEPVLPRPPDSTRRVQRAPAEGEPPVVDEQVSPEGEAPSVDRSAGGTGAPASPRTDPSAIAAPVALLETPPAEPDELRRISGIGRVMERQLNSKGIWLYRQLAGLTPEGVAWLTGKIGGTPGRIERDRWAEQARELHREKYGRDPDEADG